MNDDLISRADAIQAVRHAWAKGLEPSQYIEIVPAVDAAPVVHGHYVKGSNGEWYCSNCKRIDEKYSVARYCWYCGAKMDGGKNDAE